MSNMLEYKGFYTKMNYEEETSTFYGKLEGILDLISFEANNPEDFKSEFKKIVKNYIEECKEEGKNPYEQYKGNFNVNISSELHKKATIFADSFDISLNQFVAQAILHEIEKCENERV